MELNLTEEIKSLPPELKKEVRDFIDFLIIKYAKSNHTIKKRKFGAGKALMSKDFDEPLKEFEKYI